jgi:hypothetical protein
MLFVLAPHLRPADCRFLKRASCAKPRAADQGLVFVSAFRDFDPAAAACSRMQLSPQRFSCFSQLSHLATIQLELHVLSGYQVFCERVQPLFSRLARLHAASYRSVRPERVCRDIVPTVDLKC